MVIQKKELLLLLKPYYWVNIALTCSYVFCKKMDLFCQYIFSPTEKTCEFDTVSDLAFKRLIVKIIVWIIEFVLIYICHMLFAERIRNITFFDDCCHDTNEKGRECYHDSLPFIKFFVY